tara:strand:- start:4290 stop:5615 length:1326 start_codon:yes stop_codon:yes gene_type:complete
MVKKLKKKITTKKNTIMTETQEQPRKFTVAETFVGCGGAHFGFKKSGYESVFINDIWEDSMKTLKQNDPLMENNKIILDDIYNIDADYLKKRDIKYDNLDVLIGGVVCKGFSLAGIRNPFDERNYLYIQQLRLVEFIKPKISIIENVPGMEKMKILSKTNDEEINKLCNELNDICEQHKQARGKLIAEKKKQNNNSVTEDEKEDIDEPTNIIIDENINNLTKSMKDLTEKRKEIENILADNMYYVLDDIKERYENMGYTVYTKVLMCSNYGCSTNRKRLFIVATRNDLNLEWEYPEPTTEDNKPTVRDALNKLDYDGINNPSVDNDNCPMNHRQSTVEKFKKVKANEKSNDSYFSRGTSSRLDYDTPAPTLVPGHSSFQIHPEEHRSISVREGAIITGFDNDFKFYGSHTSRCIQIGNAIPVNMAYHLAEQCKKILSKNIK